MHTATAAFKKMFVLVVKLSMNNFKIMRLLTSFKEVEVNMIVDLFSKEDGTAIFFAWTTPFSGILYVETLTDIGGKGFELVSKSEWDSWKSYYRAS